MDITRFPGGPLQLHDLMDKSSLISFQPLQYLFTLSADFTPFIYQFTMNIFSYHLPPKSYNKL